MTEYSVITNNRFALSIDEDEDLYELLEKQQAEKKKKEELAAELALKAKAAAAANKGKTDKRNNVKGTKRNVNVKFSENTNKQSQNSVTNRPTFPRNDENRPPRFARQDRDGPTDNLNFEKPPQDFDRKSGFGGRGRGGMRGGFNANRPRREFERHSGSDKTGVKAVEKRDGGGPHNWGDEIQAQLDQPSDQQKEETSEQLQGGQDAAEELNDSGNSPEPVAEEPKQMTLDEWKASQTRTKMEFKVRRANEGSDSKQWKGTVALQKKKKGDTSEEEDEEYEDEEPEIGETKANLQKLHIEVKFSDNNNRGRGRGRGGSRDFRTDRQDYDGSSGFDGGSRGRREFDGTSRGSRGGRGGRGGGFNTRKAPAVPRVDNEADFPSLGSR